MAKEFVRLNTRIDQWKDLYNDLTNDVGDIALLTTGTTGAGISTLTGSDSDLVTAVNELDMRLDSANSTQINSDKLLMRGATSINTIKGHLDIGKTLDVTDSASFADNVSIDGAANIGGTLTAGATTLESTLDVADSASFANNISVDGSTVLGGVVTANSTVTVTGTTTLDGSTIINGTANFASTGAVKVPVGTTAQRISALRGHVRYNVDESTFEGYDGSNWGSLGGVKDADGDTYITAERTSGADSDLLNMFIANNLIATVEANGITLSSGKDFKSGITLNTSADRIGGAINELQAAIGLLDSDAASQGSIIGILANLTTTDKSTIVNAINELDSGIAQLNLDLVAGDDALDIKIGTLNSLNTTDKTDIVSALNETYDRIPNIYDENDTLLNG